MAGLSYWDGTNEIPVTAASLSYWDGTIERTLSDTRRFSYWDGAREIPLLPESIPDKDIDLTGYTLTFEDTFDTLSVTTASPKGAATWYYLPPYGSAGYYSDSTWTVSALSVQNGVLHNKAYLGDQPGTWGTYWYSGNVSSVDTRGIGFSQKYGYFEARIKMPDSGTGAWPAFWLDTLTNIPYVDGQSKNLEIDIFEWYGVTNDATPEALIQQASHNWNPATGKSDGGLYKPSTPMPWGAYPWEGYHIYGCRVDPLYITWYIDGVQTNQTPTPTDYLTGPLYIMIDYAVGGGWPRTGMVDGSEMLVDWVRVWSLPQ